MTRFRKHVISSFGILMTAFVALLLFTGPAMADCKRGTLDVRYCDEDGDLVADGRQQNTGKCRSNQQPLQIELKSAFGSRLLALGHR